MASRKICDLCVVAVVVPDPLVSDMTGVHMSYLAWKMLRLCLVWKEMLGGGLGPLGNMGNRIGARFRIEARK
jgi:hypothetical protein